MSCLADAQVLPCMQVYKRVLDKPTCEVREAGVCMRENDFYVGTVRAFRDRRYEYKGLNKKWKGKLDEAKVSIVHSTACNQLLHVHHPGESVSLHSCDAVSF